MDRLRLDGPRIEAMAAGVETVAALDDPLAGTLEQWRTEAGLEIARTPIPIGVVAIIYESRPNVTADAASLCIKSGNAVLLKGGKEAIGSNSVIADLFIEELDAAGLPAHTAQLVRSVEREATHVMLAQDELIDLIIPRGGPGLVRAIAEHSRIPVIKHYEGVCHTYVDSSADLGMAADISFNAKVQRPGVCNAMENLLVHEDAATAFLPLISERLIAAGVELRGCERTRELLPETAAANEEDWTTEYLDLILAVKVVDSLDSAIDFINTHGSGHSDCIVANDEQRAGRFLAAVDSAVVFENASTRFNDGYEFGFGAEVGISTNRLHARGPMGLRELTTYKYVVRGQGQVR
jgi:glutamate-5-semialdehyde dehydrogenase